MEKLMIKVGGNMRGDLRKAWHNPKSLKALGDYRNVLYIKDNAQLMDLFSPQKIGFLKQIVGAPRGKNVSELARESGRKQEAISRDAAVLEKYGAIRKVKKGRNVYLEPRIKSIEIVFG